MPTLWTSTTAPLGPSSTKSPVLLEHFVNLKCTVCFFSVLHKFDKLTLHKRHIIWVCSLVVSWGSNLGLFDEKLTYMQGGTA